jgi:hypothetical protein
MKQHHEPMDRINVDIQEVVGHSLRGQFESQQLLHRDQISLGMTDAARKSGGGTLQDRFGAEVVDDLEQLLVTERLRHGKSNLLRQSCRRNPLVEGFGIRC